MVNDMLLEQSSVLRLHGQIPRGALVIMGHVDGRPYKIILDYQSYSTYVPRHLRSLLGFDIEFRNTLTSVNADDTNVAAAAAAADAADNGSLKGPLLTQAGIRKELERIEAMPHQLRRQELNELFLANMLSESGGSGSGNNFTTFHNDEHGLGPYASLLEDGDLNSARLEFPNHRPEAEASGISNSLAGYLQNLGIGSSDADDNDELPRTRAMAAAHQQQYQHIVADVPHAQSCIDGYRRLGMFLDPHISERQRWRMSQDPAYCVNQSRVYFSLTDHQISLDNNLLYNVVFESPFDDVIVFGKHTLRYLSIFVDMKELKVLISPSYHMFIGSSANFYICMLAAFLLTSSWLISSNTGYLYAAIGRLAGTADNQPPPDDLAGCHLTVVLVLVLGQLWSAVFCIVGTAVMIWGYRTDRFMYHFGRTAFAWQFTAALGCFIFMSCGCVIFLNAMTWVRLVYHGEHGPRALLVIVARWRATDTLRRYLHDCSAALLIWMCLLQHHQTLVDVLYLLVIAMLMTINATFISFKCSYQKQGHGLFTRVTTLAAYAFLFWFNLLPAIDIIWGRHHPHRIFMACIFLTACVYAPTVYLYSMYQRKQFTNKAYTEDILMPFKQE